MSVLEMERRPAGDVYGRVITGNDIERAALNVLRDTTRFERILREVERQEGRMPGDLPMPRAYVRASEFAKRPEDQVPAVVVISPGLADRPRRQGDGTVIASWSLAAGIVVSASGSDAARDNALTYIAALRLRIAREGSLGGLAMGVEWEDEEYDSAPFGMTRSLFMVRTIFKVAVEDTLTYPSGRQDPPDTDDPLAPPMWPEARRVLAVVDGVRAPTSLTLTHPLDKTKEGA